MTSISTLSRRTLGAGAEIRLLHKKIRDETSFSTLSLDRSHPWLDSQDAQGSLICNACAWRRKGWALAGYSKSLTPELSIGMCMSMCMCIIPCHDAILQVYQHLAEKEQVPMSP